MDSFDYFDSNNLQMNIMFMNYLTLSQSGSYDYLFDYNYSQNDIKPKINIIKRTSPQSKKKLVLDSNIILNSKSNSKVHCDNKM